MNSKINIDKFICDLFSIEFNDDEKEKIQWKCESWSIYAPLYVAFMAIEKALKQQGLVYKNGEIVELDQPPLTEEQKSITTPGSYDKSMYYSTGKHNTQTIKFNKELLMEIAKPESIEEKYNIDIEEMMEIFKSKMNYDVVINTPYKYIAEKEVEDYRQGLVDMLKVIKGGE